MIYDAQNLFSSAQALTATADATNVIDLSQVRHIADGTPMSVYIHVGVAANTADADETYEFLVRSDDNASLTSDTTIASRTIAGSALTLNSLHEIPLPQNATFERYLGVVYTLGGTTPSITVTTWLAPTGSLPSVRTYANGYNA